jgi:hypothetical protein
MGISVSPAERHFFGLTSLRSLCSYILPIL